MARQPVQISHVRVAPEDASHHEKITLVKAIDPESGTTYTARRGSVWFAIKLGVPFVVTVGSDTVSVEAYEASGGVFIRTKPDKTTKDNLLSLPRF